MDEVLYEQRGHISYITLNRPEAMNALSTAVRQGLHDGFSRFQETDDAWVAIVTGAGDRAFCAGADLKEMSQRNKALHGGGRDGFWDPETPSLSRGLKVWKPIIAAINGYCLAGGLELALSCDMRIAAEHATFALTEVMRGIIPGGGGTQRLPRLIPFGVALEMMFTGDRIDAARAMQVGLVNQVVPAAELMSAAERLANRILQNAPLSLRAIKESAYRGMDESLEDGLRLEGMLSRIIRTTSDSVEGPTAFAEKRPAAWKGR
ncbi:MAG: enoyl-CoA hydratase-related protein [Dehalococcoidia bacterium]